MNKLIGLLLLCSQPVLAQYPFTARIIDEDNRRALPAASVSIEHLQKGAVADSNGVASISGLAAGRYDFHFTCAGYRERIMTITIPITEKDTLVVTLEPSAETLQDVVVSVTRLNQKISSSPVAISVINQDDIEEGTAMSPGNIRELLTELSGTQVQRTSAVTGNTTIRLQGLDGRYTQLLKDGFPLYSGFSRGLSIMQVPPLDLKQVEVIKGPGAALYGGDAIAGIINLVTKTPDSMPHADLVLNQTTRQGTDLSGFYSKRNRKTGITLLATTSHQQAVDVNNDGFTDLPKVKQLTVNPVFYWYPNDQSTLRLGLNISTESRNGGDMEAVKHGADSSHPFLEENHSDRNYYQLSYTHTGSNNQVLTLKNTAGYFYRSVALAGQLFSGTQIASFSEASLLIPMGNHQAIAGLNLVTDKFRPANSAMPLGYLHNTVGFFAQDDWKINRALTLETGTRVDLSGKAYFLPRMSLLYRVSPQLSARIGGGLGYKLPTIFTAQTEEDGYRKVYPLEASVQAERSSGGNISLTYTGNIGDDIRCRIDQDFYFTRLTNALVPQEDSLQKGWLYYINAAGPVHSKGFATNARFSVEEWSLLLSYTYTDARRLYNNLHPEFPITPRSRFVTTLMYEHEPGFRAGVEGFYTGSQYLDDGSATMAFWTFDAMAEKTFGHFSVIANIENFTDTRQSRFGPMFTGTRQNPVFSELYAPTEGIIANIALRFRW